MLNPGLCGVRDITSAITSRFQALDAVFPKDFFSDCLQYSVMRPKDSDVMANTVDPDQTAPKEQVNLGLHSLVVEAGGSETVDRKTDQWTTRLLLFIKADADVIKHCQQSFTA